MEMIHKMPESCYELSLKDIVDERYGLQEEVAEKNDMQDRSFHSDTEAQTRKHKNKKKKFKIGRLSRIGSMDNETFLIKMFFPNSLGSNMKAKAVNHSKVSTSSSKQSENHKKIDGWITRFTISGVPTLISYLVAAPSPPATREAKSKDREGASSK
ncbi:hypothetical protein FNV43_RR18917 [Rhamnella rubrinervis]|uniref:Uncharacterized protein n=1 Tax=Rhamnella rubrinervis TaxID=2594499 RepID=A0A8K0E4M9_9ROSA|nr:hypothetical protein FNV43_RR18917 [Rhamnella rubrinervis]